MLQRSIFKKFGIKKEKSRLEIKNAILNNKKIRNQRLIREGSRKIEAIFSRLGLIEKKVVLKKKQIRRKPKIYYIARKGILHDVKEYAQNKFKAINPLVVKSILYSKFNYHLYSKQTGLNTSVYDLIKYYNKKSKRDIPQEIPAEYQKLISDSIYKKNPQLVYNIYNYLVNKKKPKWKPIQTKRRFNEFFSKNNLYQIFNLKQDFPYPNLLKLNSEIQRAAVFRNLVNKEAAYYKTVKTTPLVLLISPKPKNIHVTLYRMSSNGYTILWKKSTGMLQKVEGTQSFPALLELFTKINIFLTKQYLRLKSPLKLIIKSTKYYGTSNIIGNFVRFLHSKMRLNQIYFMYKYRKRFNFFSNYGNLINDSLFNYLSSIWIKFLKLIRRTKLNIKFIFPFKQLEAYNKFFGLDFDYMTRKYKINHVLRLKHLKYFQNKILNIK